MSDLSGLNPHLILGYSGCDRDVGEAALSSGPEGLVASNNGYDWLGTGVYFWENDPNRAMQWANEAKVRHLKRNKESGTPIKIRRPFVVGAVIRLGNCLDLTTVEGIGFLKAGYDGFVKDHEVLTNESPSLSFPANTPDEDMRGRYLDLYLPRVCNDQQ